jgi:acetate---CoA ligase (ADP-forming)
VSDFEVDFLKETRLPPEIGGLQHGLAAFAAAAEWSESRQRHMQKAEALAASDSKRFELPSGELRGPWPEYRALDWLAANGVPVVPWRLAKSGEEAVDAANEFGYPVVVKVASAQLPHKSAMGGVVLGLANAKGVRDAFEAVVAAAYRHDASIEIDGTLVMPMRERALEIIVGIVRDPTWGLTLAVGLGGVWTEVLNDSKVTPLPVSTEEVKRLLMGLRGARMFSGGHGIPEADVEKLVQAIACLAELAAATADSLESLEVNPIRVAGDAIEALDALVVWQDP